MSCSTCAPARRLDRGLRRDLEPALEPRPPAGWTRADAAGLPILPLLARHGEAQRGRIDHALRVTVPRAATRVRLPRAALRPSDPDPSLPRMGERLRLKAGVDISGFPRQARVSRRR